MANIINLANLENQQTLIQKGDIISGQVFNVDEKTSRVETEVADVKNRVARSEGTVNTINSNIGTPTSGASNATGSNAHAKLNYILNKTSKNLLSSSPIMGSGQGWSLNNSFDRPNVVFGNTLFSIMGPCAIFNLKISMYSINTRNASVKVTIDGKSFYYDAINASGTYIAGELPFISCTSGITVATSKGEINASYDPWGVSYSHYHLL